MCTPQDIYPGIPGETAENPGKGGDERVTLSAALSSQYVYTSRYLFLFQAWEIFAVRFLESQEKYF